MQSPIYETGGNICIFSICFLLPNCPVSLSVHWANSLIFKCHHQCRKKCEVFRTLWCSSNQFTSLGFSSLLPVVFFLPLEILSTWQRKLKPNYLNHVFFSNIKCFPIVDVFPTVECIFNQNNNFKWPLSPSSCHFIIFLMSLEVYPSFSYWPFFFY